MLKHEDLSLDRGNLKFLTAVLLQSVLQPQHCMGRGGMWEDHCGFLDISPSSRFSERAGLSGIKLRNKEVERDTRHPPLAFRTIHTCRYTKYTCTTLTYAQVHMH